MRGGFRVRRRLAATLSAPRKERYRFATGTITRVDAGASLDSLDAAFVTVNGSELPAPYRDGYSPTLGDFVQVELTDGSPYIVGLIRGLPDF